MRDTHGHGKNCCGNTGGRSNRSWASLTRSDGSTRAAKTEARPDPRSTTEHPWVPQLHQVVGHHAAAGLKIQSRKAAPCSPNIGLTVRAPLYERSSSKSQWHRHTHAHTPSWLFVRALVSLFVPVRPDASRGSRSRVKGVHAFCVVSDLERVFSPVFVGCPTMGLHLL